MNIERWSVLAWLRFVLAFIVTVDHLRNILPTGNWNFIPNFGPFEAILGFLLISGYSIAASYQKEPDGFLGRRLKRIYPIYAASLVLALVVFMMEESSFPSAWTVVANLLFLNQIFTSESLVGPAWTLALEFWLYCLTPFFFKARLSTLKWMTYGSFLAYLGYTCGRTLFHWDYYAGIGYGVNLLLLSFIWLAGLRLVRDPSNARAILIEIGVMFALHIGLAAGIEGAANWKHGTTRAFFQHGLENHIFHAFTLLAVFWIFRKIIDSLGGKASASSTLRLLGDISYPLYVTHISVFFLLKRAGFESPTLYLLAAVGSSFLLYLILDKYSQARHAVGEKKAESKNPLKMIPGEPSKT